MIRPFIAGVFAALVTLSGAAAQDWPSRPITLVVPFAPGGANDVLARLIQPHLSESLGQQVVIENIGGAGGMVGAARVAKAAPDGYTFLIGTVGSQAYSQTLYKKPLYNSTTDFAPVALLADQPTILVTKKELPPNTLQEFLAYAKVNAKAMQYGSAGVGSATHLACILFNQVAGLDVTHIPYRGGAPLLQDMIAGRIDYWCGLTTLTIPQIGKTIKGIAMLAKQRLPVLPDLPTAHEQGMANFEASNWSGLFAPKGTPEAIVRKLNEAAIKALQMPSVQARLRKIGATAPTAERSSPAYLGKFVQDEVRKWAVAIKASGVSVD